MKNINSFLFHTGTQDQIKVIGKPFIKWVGGKGSLTDILIENLPKKYNNYYEPFVGGGALFFKENPKTAFLSDINLELITTYNVIRNNVIKLIKKLELYKKKHDEKGKDYYLKIRALNKLEDDIVIAARFIYLNKTCFNGLYRVNKGGIFNVPMGSYKNPLIVDKETLMKDSTVLQSVTIECKEYHEIKPLKNDFIYFDPPYDETYNGYDKNIFNFKKQKDLSLFCKRLDNKGCFFMLSNSDTQNIRELYKEFNIIEVNNIRSVNCKGNGRGKVKELLIKNYE